MSDNSDKLNGEEDDVTTIASFLSEFMRPIFHDSNSNSNISLLPSSVLNSGFVFPAESLHILDESIKGYIQFSLTWNRNKQPLDFIPLEKVEDYYPEEIEDELILPYYASNKPAAVQRKVTAYSSNPVQGTEIPAIPDNTTAASDSFGNVLPKSMSRKSPTHDYEPTRYETSAHKKESLKNIIFKEDGPSGKREPGPSTKTKKNSAHETTRGFNTESTTSLRTNSLSKGRSVLKDDSGMPHPSHGETTKSAPVIHDKPKGAKAAENLQYKKGASPLNENVPYSSTNKQDKSDEPPNIVDSNVPAKAGRTRSIFPRILKPPRNAYHNNDDTRVLAESSAKIVSNSGNELPSIDDNSTITGLQNKIENHELAKIHARQKYASRSSLSYQSDNVLPNLDKRGSPSEKSDNTSKIMSKTTMANIKQDFSSSGHSTNNYHDRRSIVPNKEERNTVGEDNKSPIPAHRGLDDIPRKKDLAHNYEDPDAKYSKLGSAASINLRREKIPSTIDSLNLSRVNDLLAPEDSVTPPFNLSNVSRHRTLKKPTIRTVFDTVSTSDSSSITAETDNADSPAMTINRLDVTVVGDSMHSANTGNSSTETGVSSEETSHYFSEYGIGSLNKSYLWRYKVKF